MDLAPTNSLCIVCFFLCVSVCLLVCLFVCVLIVCLLVCLFVYLLSCLFGFCCLFLSFIHYVLIRFMGVCATPPRPDPLPDPPCHVPPHTIDQNLNLYKEILYKTKQKSTGQHGGKNARFLKGGSRRLSKTLAFLKKPKNPKSFLLVDSVHGRCTRRPLTTFRGAWEFCMLVYEYQAAVNLSTRQRST